MNIRKCAVAAFAAVAMMVPLAACGSGTASDGGKTTISYFSWNNEKMMSPIVDAFEKANPNIEVKLTGATGSAAEYTQTLTTRAAGNQMPDVFQMSIETRTSIMDAGLAKDLTDEPFMKSIPKTQNTLYERDGKVYGMSPTVWVGGIIYNKDLLKKAGYDSVPETLDEFIALGKKLQDQGVTPYMEDLTAASGSFQPMLGGYYAKQGIESKDWPEMDEGGSFTKEWTPVLKQWLKLTESGTMPKETVGVQGDQIKQNFLTGQLAMFRGGPWDFNDLNSAGINYGIAAYPAVDGGEPYVGGGPDSPYAISSSLKGDKLKAAEKFLSFLNSKEGLKLAEENMNQISVSSEYSANVPDQLKDMYNKYVKEGKNYWVNWTRNSNEMNSELVSQLQLLVQGQTTVDAVTKDLDAKWAEK